LSILFVSMMHGQTNIRSALCSFFFVLTTLKGNDVKLRGESTWYRILKVGIVVYLKV
jgi:hypothetical protein